MIGFIFFLSFLEIHAKLMMEYVKYEHVVSGKDDVKTRFLY